MSQENKLETRLALFQPQPKAEIQAYQRTDDLDQKALILNRHIIRVEEAVATAESVTNLVMIFAQEQRGVSGYKSDAVAGLNEESLIAVVNGLTVYDQRLENPVSSAIRTIQEAAESTSFAEVGFSTPQRSVQKDEDTRNLENEVLTELVDRLTDDSLGFEEHRYLISCISGMLTPEALREISKRGEVLGALLRSVNEFSNPELRDALKRLLSKQVY